MQIIKTLRRTALVGVGLIVVQPAATGQTLWNCYRTFDRRFINQVSGINGDGAEFATTRWNAEMVAAARRAVHFPQVAAMSLSEYAGRVRRCHGFGVPEYHGSVPISNKAGDSEVVSIGRMSDAAAGNPWYARLAHSRLSGECPFSVPDRSAL